MSTPYHKGTPPTPTKAQHRIVVKGQPPGQPQPKPGFHPAGPRGDTLKSDTGSSQQQQQLQDKGGN